MGSKSDIIRRWYDEVWSNGRFDRIDEFYQPAADGECLIADAIANISDARDIIAALNSLVAKQTVRVLHVIENGDWVSALVELRGVKAGTEIPVKLHWLNMARIEDDRIVESYPCANLLPFFEQLGQLPEYSFELLLSGNALK